MLLLKWPHSISIMQATIVDCVASTWFAMLSWYRASMANQVDATQSTPVLAARIQQQP